ncbi:excinuclease ABC subunit A [Paraglaciecola sp.]|uniref:excinuclease ABC subunit A n=1 Tax=Paraglaciecola sp. TaxID=1920173 RepID=UPI0030F3A2BC
MNKLLIACLGTSLLMSTAALAKDDRLKFSIDNVLKSDKAKNVLYDVPLYFADQAHAKPERKLVGMTTSQKTNAFNKSDQEACEWAFLSAIKALQAKAQQEGMNAVVNITSNYKHDNFASTTEFECGSGNIIAGVALKADIAKLP